MPCPGLTRVFPLPGGAMCSFVPSPLTLCIRYVSRGPDIGCTRCEFLDRGGCVVRADDSGGSQQREGPDLCSLLPRAHSQASPRRGYRAPPTNHDSPRDILSLS
eukprot:3933012-Rhodomonas_salina.7